MKHVVLLLAIITFVPLAERPATAQEATKEGLVEISPAAVPKAALENPLLPPPAETTRGNAALLYLRASTMAGDLKTQMADARKNLPGHLESPADEFAVEDTRKDVAAYEHALNELKLGAT